VGKFGGLIETLDEAIKYPIYFEGEGTAAMSFSAGPTCVSMDILYEKDDLHDARNSQDRGQSLTFSRRGPIPKVISSVYFNGFSSPAIV